MYNSKYQKYKQKYLNLKSLVGGFNKGDNVLHNGKLATIRMIKNENEAWISYFAEDHTIPSAVTTVNISELEPYVHRYPTRDRAQTSGLFDCGAMSKTDILSFLHTREIYVKNPTTNERVRLTREEINQLEKEQLCDLAKELFPHEFKQ